ncbi:MAG: cell envelope integrity protein TolA [Pseudomonadales bacterium]
MKLDHSYILPSLMALMVHIVVAFIVMTEWQSQSKRTPPVQIKQRVEATLIDLDSLLAQQKQVVSAADKKAADKKVADRKVADKKAAEQKVAQQLAEVEQALDNLLDDEDAQMQALEQEATNSQAVASAVNYIRNEIIQRWVRPANARTGMVVELVIHLVPTGEVVDIEIRYRDDSATDAFVASAVKAVRKVGRFDKLSQLKAGLFDANFREFNFLFKPEDLRL